MSSASSDSVVQSVAAVSCALFFMLRDGHSLHMYVCTHRNVYYQYIFSSSLFLQRPC